METNNPFAKKDDRQTYRYSAAGKLKRGRQRNLWKRTVQHKSEQSGPT